jgi:hypothetical protein
MVNELDIWRAANLLIRSRQPFLALIGLGNP